MSQKKNKSTAKNIWNKIKSNPKSKKVLKNYWIQNDKEYSKKETKRLYKKFSNCKKIEKKFEKKM